MTSDERVFDLLIVDDDPSAILFVKEALAGGRFTVYGVTDAKAGLDFITRNRPAVVLLDLAMPGVVGFETLERILEIDPGIDVILFTGNYSTDSAVEAIQKGAFDYLTKPISIERLRGKLDGWLETAQVRQQKAELDRQLLCVCQLAGIVGHSPLILDVFSRIRRVAPHFQSLLIMGETGTGKELVAKALHDLSPASAGPFIVCNCAAIPDTLFESELFGHVRGAFTGASQDREGIVEAAQGGTLFLDEIAEVPLAIQAKLLRLFQNREIQRVGASRPKQVNVRIVAATNGDLAGLVKEKKFREDLYFRLAMIAIKLPRLVDRQEDLPLLQQHFLELLTKKFDGRRFHLTRRAQALLAAYSWPGNVRELEHVLEYCCMLAEGDVIDVKDLPEQFRQKSPSLDGAGELMTMEQMEIAHAFRVLDGVRGHRDRAAEILGIGRTTLYRLLKKNISRSAVAQKDSAFTKYAKGSER